MRRRKNKTRLTLQDIVIIVIGLLGGSVSGFFLGAIFGMVNRVIGAG